MPGFLDRCAPSFEAEYLRYLDMDLFGKILFKNLATNVLGILEANLDRLRGFRTAKGKKFDVITLPMPEPFSFQGQRVPASYANFLIINGAVLVPTFQQPERDAEACEIIGGCFPEREIVPIDCYHLIWGLGTLHCISQQQPAAG